MCMHRSVSEGKRRKALVVCSGCDFADCLKVNIKSYRDAKEGLSQ